MYNFKDSFCCIFFFTEFPSIRPIPCENRMTGDSGVCTFNWSCKNVAHGIHIGNCVDRFFVGTCCKIPEAGGFGGSQPTPSTSTEEIQGETETNTEKIKDSIQVEPFRENISANVLPKQETENIPVPVKSNLNINYDLHSHHNKLFPATTIYTETSSSSSLNRKPVLLDTFTTDSSSDSIDFLNYKHSFSELETSNSDSLPTQLESFPTIKNDYSNFASVPQFDSSTSLSSDDQVTTLKLNNGETLQEVLFDSKNPPNSSEDDSNLFIGNNLTNQWTVPPETDDATLSFVFKDSTKDLYQTETNLHEEKLPGDTFHSFIYSFLTNGNKNISINETNPSTSFEQNSSTLPSSDYSFNPSHHIPTTQHESNADMNSSHSTMSDTVSTASATTVDALTHFDNSVNINKVSANITKFTEPQYPWPSPSSTTENSTINISQAVMFHDATRSK